MKRYFYIFTYCLLLIAQISIAQKKELTLDDAVLRGRTLLSPKRLNQLSFLPKSDNYAFTFNEKLVLTHAYTQSVDTIDALTIIKKQLNDIKISRFPMINWRSSNEFYFITDNTIYTFNTASLATKKMNRISEEAEDIDIHPTSLNAAYTVHDALYVAVNNQQILIGEPEKDGIVYGKSVHRQEFGIEKGTFWNNSGNRLAFYRMDESMVTKYPIYVLESKPATARYIRYPMSGATSHHVDVYVYDLATRKPVKLDITGPDDQYITNISWSNDDKYILLAIVNRDQNHMRLNQYDAYDGKFIKTLFEERNEKYVEPLHPAICTKDNKYILWQSQRDGYNSLYIYDWNGKLVRQLTKNIIVVEVLKMDESEKNIYAMAVKPNSITRYVIRINLSSGKTDIIGKEIDNVLQALINDAGTFCILHISTPQIPRRYDLV